MIRPLALGGLILGLSLVQPAVAQSGPRTSLEPHGGVPTIVPPRGWLVYHLDSAGGSFSTPLAFLSNRRVPLSGPPGCRIGEPVGSCAPWIPARLVNKHTGLADCTPRNTITVCAPGRWRLAPAQAFISWEQVGILPVPMSRPLAGTRLTVDGHEARLAIRQGKPLTGFLFTCPAGTSESIVARIYEARPYYQHGSRAGIARYSDWYEMDACLRGPGLGRLQAQVLAVFRSAQGVP